MNTLSKALVGTVAAGAMALSAASPASARDRYGNGGVSVGDVIAGAVIIGGIAAVAGSIGNRNGGGYGSTYGSPYDYRGGNYNNGGYGSNYGDRYDRNRGNPRDAVERCVQAAQSNAGRAYSRADVTQITSVDRSGRGYQVRGNIQVDGGNRYDNNRGYGGNYGGNYPGNYGGNYNNGYAGNYGGNYGNGWNNNDRNDDSGSFRCKVEYGQVVNLDYSGIRGL